MVAALTDELQMAGIKFIVAPFEADAQLAYLAQHGYVDMCISEDSDLLAFGCPKVLYKLKPDGQTREICLEDALGALTHEEFLTACIMMGCDYLPRLPRVGPRTALALVGRFGAELRTLTRELRHMGVNMPRDYHKMFGVAWEAFLGQTVLDPISGEAMPLMKPAGAADHPLGDVDQARAPFSAGAATDDDVGEAGGVDDFEEENDDEAVQGRAAARRVAAAARRDGQEARGRRRRRPSPTPSPSPPRRAPELGGSAAAPEVPAKRARRAAEPERERGGREIAVRSEAEEHGRAHSHQSAFISDTWMPAKLCKRASVTLDDFLRREARAGGRVCGRGQPGVAAGGNTGGEASSDDSAERSLDFKGRPPATPPSRAMAGKSGSIRRSKAFESPAGQVEKKKYHRSRHFRSGQAR